MTFYPISTSELTAADISPFHMAVIDDAGHETPITEIDIRRSLKLLESDADNENQYKQALDSLMERVYAARAIA